MIKILQNAQVHLGVQARLYGCYLRKGIVHIPTFGEVENRSGHRAGEPVAVVPVSDTDALRNALGDTIARGNPIVPRIKRYDHPPWVLLRYSGAKTDTAFERHHPLGHH